MFFRLLTLSVVLMLGTTIYAQTPRKANVRPTTVRMTVTGYCMCKKCCGPGAHGVTASGHPVTANYGKFCAAPRNFPFGTLLAVPGYNGGNPIPVYDRGGAIKGKHVDLFFETHEEAQEWGKKMLDVTVWR